MSKRRQKKATSTWDATMLATYQINAIGAEGCKPTEVLLDNQANIAIIRQELLTAFENAENEVQVNGVGGVQLHTSDIGHLRDFFRVYSSTDMKANVLSFSDVQDLLWYNI